MATYAVRIPASGITSPLDFRKIEYINMLRKMEREYGTYFTFAAEASRIPKKVLMAFTAVESSGDPLAGGAGSETRGLMQWNKKYMKEQLEREFKQGRLSAAEKTKLAQYGIKFDSNGKTRTITQADQIKPELNILLGAMLLGQMADEDWASTGDTIHFDRIIVVYNAGGYGDSGKKAKSGNYATPAALAAVVNDISSRYIRKMLGANGALHILTTTLANEIK